MSDYLNLKELMGLTGLKRGMVERLMNKNDPAHDSAFPSPVPTVNNALRWRRADVERWQSGRELDELEAVAWAESTGRARADLLNLRELAVSVWGCYGIHWAELDALTGNNPRYAAVGFPAPVKPDGVKLWERAAVEAWKTSLYQREFALWREKRGW